MPFLFLPIAFLSPEINSGNKNSRLSVSGQSAVVVYYDINSWEPRFHEAERSLRGFYQTRDTKCLKPVQELLDDFQPTKISFEFVEEKQFTEVLYPQNMYDLMDFSLRKCVQEKS